VRAAWLVLVPAIASADPKPESKKDKAWAAKSTQHADAPKPGTRAARLVNLYNGWTDEWLAIEPGTKVSQATLDRFLRDHYTNQPGTMEPRLADILISAADHFKSDRVIVVSGFRHPKYNLLLRKKGHQVARDSHHTHGNAVDFNIPKVTTDALHAWAKDQKIGGVGLYLQSGFIHMDTGPVRYWSGE
jgi:uncharacterized protein YcbK (DUF882 family)